jgi:general transcriptional corepressor CYC8
LDAYSRAIRLNPFISEVWYDLGTLYESCNNQINDALDAYHRAAELDPTNPHIKQRLQMLRNQQAQGGQTTAPIPQDVNPQSYQSLNGPPVLGNPPTFAQPTPGPPGPPGMPTYGSRQDNRQSHPQIPISLSALHHGDSTHRDLPPMSRGDLSMQRGDLPPMSAPMSISRSPGPSGSYAPQPPSHLRESRPPTSPNQHPISNPIMSPTDPRSLTQPPQTPLRSDKRTSPPPTLPQIQDDRRSRYSPTLRPNYPSSPPRMAASEHSNSQHSGYHQQSHEITYHSPEMHDHKKHTSEQLPSSHDPHPSHLTHLEYREKPEEPPVSSSLDHGSRVNILNSHQSPHQIDQHDHRMHVDNGSVEDKGIPPFSSFRQDDIRRRSPPIPPIQLPEIKEGPSRPPTTVNLDSPRENYGNDNHSPVSSIPSGENQRKSSTDQHSNRGPLEMSRELPKPPAYQEELQQQQSSHSPSEPPTLPRINLENQSSSPSSPRDNELNKPILPSIKNNDRGGSSTRQAEDDDYDNNTSDLVNETGSTSGSIGQKRPYSPTPKIESDVDNREDSSKRSKPSPPTPGIDVSSPVSSHSERDREQTRERRKSEQSANGSVAQSPELE